MCRVQGDKKGSKIEILPFRGNQAGQKNRDGWLTGAQLSCGALDFKATHWEAVLGTMPCRAGVLRAACHSVRHPSGRGHITLC